jgi:hypothetical protein
MVCFDEQRLLSAIGAPALVRLEQTLPVFDADVLSSRSSPAPVLGEADVRSGSLRIGGAPLLHIVVVSLRVPGITLSATLAIRSSVRF